MSLPASTSTSGARADLHLHTTASDGRLAPRELVAKAHRAGLQAIAVTDHDTVAGVAAAQAEGRSLDVEVIAGVELSVTVDDREVHMLGLFVDPGYEPLQDHLAWFAEQRTVRAAGMVERLRTQGVPVSMDEVQAQAGGGAIGRPHVAAALEAVGAVGTMQEAFERYIGNGAPAFVSKPTYPAAEALRLVHEAGGLGVLAHPGHWTPDHVVMALIRAGLDGIETVHPSHDYLVTKYYRDLARDFGLIETGGSDFHGVRPRDEEVFGTLTVPYEVVARARRRIRRRAA